MTRKIKHVFIGGKQIGVNALRTLLAHEMSPELVVTNLDDDGVDTWHESLVRVAREANLPLITGRKVRDPEIVERIKNIDPDIIFCIGGMQIIPEELLKIPKLGTLNIHPALLPKYRGRFSTAHAIFNGEEYTGATVHWMDEGLDTGPIILQEKFAITQDDTARTVYDKFTETGTKLFEDFLVILESGEKIIATPQDESIATYYPKEMPGNGKIDWSWDGSKIERFIRAMTFEPFPPPEFMIGEKKMVIIDERYFPGFNTEKSNEKEEN